MPDGVTATTTLTEKPPVARKGSQSEEDIKVPQKVYLKWIKNQMEDESACLELPLTIILLLSFSVSAVFHLKQDTVFSIEHGIKDDIVENANFAFSHYFGHKDLYDAHSIADFWSWVRLGFVPLIMQPAWLYSEEYANDALRLFNSTTTPNSKHYFAGNPKPLPIKGDYLHYNRIVGGIRFRQETVPMGEDRCRFPKGQRDVWLKWYGKPCMPAVTELAFDPDTPSAESFGKPERMEWMFPDVDSLETMMGHLVDMEDGCSQLAAKNRSKCLCAWCDEQDPPLPWLTENTQRVEIQMATFNAQYGLMSLTGVNFFFNRGGKVHKHVETLSSWLDLFARPWRELLVVLSADFIWLVSLVYIIVVEMKEIVEVLRMGDMRWYQALYVEYVDFWNVVDWLSILVAIVVVSFFVELMLHTSRLNVAFGALVKASTADREAYSHIVIEFYDKLEAVTQAEAMFRMSLCVYPMMVMLRLFKSFAAQPRLAMVTETMQQAYQDLMHFSLVFMGVAICLCLNAVLLFGQDHEEFATFARSTHSCFLMMFGDWDWKPMEEVWRFAALLWFWLFMTLLVVILLNMLVAIVMDNYMNVKKGSADAITLGGQIHSMWRRYKQNKRKERVRLNDILQYFLQDAGGSDKAMMSDDRKIMPSFLLHNVKGIPQDQARRTLTNALNMHTKETEPEFKLEDVVEPLERIEGHTRLSRDALFYAFDCVDYYDTSTTDEQQPEEEAEVFADRGKLVSTEESPVSDQVLEFVNSEVQRLKYETARALAQSVEAVDKRQGTIEQRQTDMAMSVRDMEATLLNLQSEASSAVTRLQRLCYEQAKKEQSGSAWRRHLDTCSVVQPCMDLTIADGLEALLPGVR